MLETPVSDQPATTPSKLGQILTIIGAAAGIAAFLWTAGWQWNRALTSSVQIGLILNTHDPAHVVADMTVENKGDTRKRIDYAALVFTPHDQPFASATQELTSCKQGPAAFSGNDPIMAVLSLPRPENTLSCNGSLNEPHPFLYKEQQDIGDEKVGCQASVDISKLEPDKQYDVRFIVFQASGFRSTQALFFTPKGR